VVVTKPVLSRPASAERYIVCLSFKALMTDFARKSAIELLYEMHNEQQHDEFNDNASSSISTAETCEQQRRRKDELGDYLRSCDSQVMALNATTLERILKVLRECNNNDDSLVVSSSGGDGPENLPRADVDYYSKLWHILA
jgi:hypothetical protein